jgi:hypothetical protein
MKQRARRAAIAGWTAMVLLAMWAVNAAAAPQYPGGDNTGGSEAGGVAGEQVGETVVANGNGGNLPFTGADLILYVVVGLAIVASGLVLRRLAVRGAEH